MVAAENFPLYIFELKHYVNMEHPALLCVDN